MIALRSLSLASGILLIVTACSTAPAPVDTAADEAALKETTQTWLKAYNAGDPDTIASLYAEDGVLMPPNAPVARGRAAIRDYAAKDSAAAKTAGVKLATGPATAGVSGDWGWESGSFTVTDTSGKTVDSGSYLSVSHKVNGKWLYVRDTYNSDQPLPASAPAPAKTN